MVRNTVKSNEMSFGGDGTQTRGEEELFNFRFEYIQLQ